MWGVAGNSVQSGQGDRSNQALAKAREGVVKRVYGEARAKLLKRRKVRSGKYSKSLGWWASRAGQKNLED